MTPIKKQILFKPLPPNQKTQGGLFIPDSVRKDNNKGEIIAIGNEVKKVKVGDVAFRVKEWGTGIEIKNEKVFLMEENAILAII